MTPTLGVVALPAMIENDRRNRAQCRPEHHAERYPHADISEDRAKRNPQRRTYSNPDCYMICQLGFRLTIIVLTQNLHPPTPSTFVGPIGCSVGSGTATVAQVRCQLQERTPGHAARDAHGHIAKGCSQGHSDRRADADAQPGIGLGGRPPAPLIERF